MSQLPIQHEPVTTEERYAYLAQLVLETGTIVSDEQPLRITRNEANDYFDEFNAELIKTPSLFNSWDDEEGEHELEYIKSSLELVVKSTLEFLEQIIPENDLSKWGPGQ